MQSFAQPEDALVELLLDAGAVVTNPEQPAIALSPRIDLDPCAAVRRAEPDRVADQILEQQQQVFLATPHPGQLADHHLGACGRQGGRPVVLAADHGADPQPAIEEQAGYRSPDRPELTGRPGDEDRSVLGHGVSLPFAERSA